MESTAEYLVDVKKLKDKIFMSRLRIVTNNPFFGVFSMDLKYKLSDEIETFDTDGFVIRFNPWFLNLLDDEEIDICMLHAILHVVFKHPFKERKQEPSLYGKACDIVVNSNIMQSTNKTSLSVLGYELPYLAPNGKQGYLCSSDEIYEMLLFENSKQNMMKQKNMFDEEQEKSNDDFDSHECWDKNKNKEVAERMLEIDIKVIQGAELYKQKNCGDMPQFMRIIIDSLTPPQINWRVFLSSFIQENIVDYTFVQPDKRLQDFDFILPSFSEPEDEVKDLLFMVDVSGSMEEEQIITCFSEIQSAIEQFDGKIRGFVGFFDSEVKKVYEFDGDTKVKDFIVYGRGGTSFSAVFEYIKENMDVENITSIIILTDGYCDFPEKGKSMFIPVLWVINNDEVTPPWGEYITIK